MKGCLSSSILEVTISSEVYGDEEVDVRVLDDGAEVGEGGSSSLKVAFFFDGIGGDVVYGLVIRCAGDLVS